MKHSNFFSKENLSEIFKKTKNNNNNNDDDYKKRIKIELDDELPKNIGAQVEEVPPPFKQEKWETGSYKGKSILRADGLTTDPKWDRWTREYQKDFFDRDRELRKHKYYTFATIISGMVSNNPVEYLSKHFITSHGILDKETRKENIELLKIKATSYKDIPNRIKDLKEVKKRNEDKLNDINGFIIDVTSKYNNYKNVVVIYEQYLYSTLIDEILKTRTIDTDLHRMELFSIVNDFYTNNYLNPIIDPATKGVDVYETLIEAIKKTKPNASIPFPTYESFNKFINTEKIDSLKVDFKISDLYTSIYELLLSLTKTDKISKAGEISKIIFTYETYSKYITEGNVVDSKKDNLLIQGILEPFIILVKDKNNLPPSNGILDYLLDKTNLKPDTTLKDGIMRLTAIVLDQLKKDKDKFDNFININNESIQILEKREEEFATGLDTGNIHEKEYEVDYDTAFNALNTGIISLDPIMGILLTMRNTIITQINKKLKDKPLDWFLTDDRIIYLFARAVSLEIKNTMNNYGTEWYHSDAPDRLKQSKFSVYNQIKKVTIDGN